MSQFTPKLWTLLKNGYSKELLRHDMLAGLTVAIVALPLAMAIAVASGSTPSNGIITAIIAGFLISFFGGSRVQIGGPTGAFIVVVYNVILQHGYEGLILSTLLAGFILVVAGYLKLGQVIKYVPHPVVTGFTSGIAVIIATSQIKDFFGLQLESNDIDFIPRWQSYFNSWETFSIQTTIIGVLSLLIILLLRKFAPKWPGYLIAIVICSIIAFVLHMPVDTIGTRFPTMNTGFAMPSLPTWTVEKIIELIPSAFTIAFLAGIESLLSAVVADSMTGHRHKSNQELVGQGIANIASSLFGGLPATGALARTATNIKAGGKTPLAGIFHAIFLLLFILFATDIMNFIPMATLAAILLIISWSMSEFEHFIHILRLSKSDRIIIILTFLLTIFVDLTVAISVGVTLASLLFMKSMAESVQIKSDNRKLSDIYSNENEEGATQRDGIVEGVEVFHIEGPLFFGVANDFLDMLQSIGQLPQVLILRLRLVPYLDSTGVMSVENIIKQCQDNRISIILSGAQPQVVKMLENSVIVHNGVIYANNYKKSLDLAKDIITKKKD